VRVSATPWPGPSRQACWAGKAPGATARLRRPRSDAFRCPVLALACEGDPICPLPVIEEVASQLPPDTMRFIGLPGA
jgi:pimeloyl-ACP methyl ester carboxylesterase